VPPTPHDYDRLAPTIESVEFLKPRDLTQLSKDGGGNIDLSIVVRFPEGFELNYYKQYLGNYAFNWWTLPSQLAGSAFAQDILEKELKMEIGVYDYDWAMQQGWIVDEKQNWLSRLFKVYYQPLPCGEKTEANFVNTYRIEEMNLQFEDFKCDSDNPNWNSARGACFYTLKTAIKDPTWTGGGTEVPIQASIPTGSDYVTGGDKPNWNEDGNYVMIVGFYYYCGNYLNNPMSWRKINITIGPIKTHTEDTLCEEGDILKKSCSDGSTIVLQECTKRSDGTWRWDKETGNECPEEPEPDLKKLSLTKSEWKKATHKEIIQAMCDFDYQCAQIEDYEIDCIYSEEIEARNKKAYGEETGVWTRFANWLGYDTDAYLSGTCRATKISDFDYCKFTEPLAFFEITGDECQDGLIIIIGALALLFLIPKLLGGSK